MIVDTSALLAYFNRAEPAHEAVARAIDSCAEPLVVSPFVLAELDYFLLKRSGVARELAVMKALLGPAWQIARVSPDDLSRAVALAERFADDKIGVTDALNVALADACHTRLVATLDHRHFGVLRLGDGTPVQIVP